jgi:hypothetical protein
MISAPAGSKQAPESAGLSVAGYLWALSLVAGLLAPFDFAGAGLWLGLIAVSVIANLAWGAALGARRSRRLLKWSMVAAPTVVAASALVGWALLYSLSQRTEEVHYGTAALLALAIGAASLAGTALTVALGWAVGTTLGHDGR